MMFPACSSHTTVIILTKFPSSPSLYSAFIKKGVKFFQVSFLYQLNWSCGFSPLHSTNVENKKMELQTILIMIITLKLLMCLPLLKIQLCTAELLSSVLSFHLAELPYAFLVGQVS